MNVALFLLGLLCLFSSFQCLIPGFKGFKLWKKPAYLEHIVKFRRALILSMVLMALSILTLSVSLCIDESTEFIGRLFTVVKTTVLFSFVFCSEFALPLIYYNILNPRNRTDNVITEPELNDERLKYLDKALATERVFKLILPWIIVLNLASIFLPDYSSRFIIVAIIMLIGQNCMLIMYNRNVSKCFRNIR